MTPAEWEQAAEKLNALLTEDIKSFKYTMPKAEEIQPEAEEASVPWVRPGAIGTIKWKLKRLHGRFKRRL